MHEERISLTSSSAKFKMIYKLATIGLLRRNTRINQDFTLASHGCFTTATVFKWLYFKGHEIKLHLLTDEEAEGSQLVVEPGLDSGVFIPVPGAFRIGMSCAAVQVVPCTRVLGRKGSQG